MLRRCPEHTDVGITVKDDFCHDHVADAQQFFHNCHCRFLSCPSASSGMNRKGNVPVHLPRNSREKLLAGEVARVLVRLVLLK